MSEDVKQGDVLVTNGKEYAIRKVNPWFDPDTPLVAMGFICNQTAQIKRAPSPDGITKKRGDPVLQNFTLNVSPVDPPSFATQQIFIADGTHAPTNLRECYVNGGDTFYQLILEENLS